MKLYRQGDVLLKRVDKVEGQALKGNECVLAEGELTGHHHVMRGDVKFFQQEQQIQVEVGEKGALVMHEEHAQLQVPQGKYVVIRQREFDAVEGVRRVMD